MIEYRILDHTADIGLEIFGATLRDVFIHAAKGMFAILASCERIKPELSFSIEIEAESEEELLVAWLNKLLYIYDAEKVILCDFEILKFETRTLSAAVRGEAWDPDRHKIRTYIKAATYHNVNLKSNDIFQVRVIFDV